MLPDKNPGEARGGGNIYQQSKVIHDKQIVIIVSNGEKLEASYKMQNKVRMSFLPRPFNIVCGVLASATRQEKEIKGIQMGKEEIKLTLFADNMILYLRDPKHSIS